ncbi:hypothetical protein RJT34_02570 [Clitoria ternatea]|uniref:TF-B3 domain-containing protein n=1 Tax=Clitoria ternatea TaxID=43366 RepID=A0AAN9KKK2_CLITE
MSSRRSIRRECGGMVEKENGAPLSLPVNPTTNLQRGEVKPLSGKPYCCMVLLKSNLSSRYTMGPSKDLLSQLPSKLVPTVLNYDGKSWDILYSGQSRDKKFVSNGWKKFARDNSLKVGDACVFELMENSDEKVTFEVQILRGDIPSIFENAMSIGLSPEMPIVLI